MSLAVWFHTPSMMVTLERVAKSALNVMPPGISPLMRSERKMCIRDSLEAEKIDTAELIAGVMKRIVAAGIGMRLFLRTYRRNEATLYLNTGAAISSRMTIRPPVINRRASSTILPWSW